MPWEEVGHEIRHRVRDPEDFRQDTFRTKKLEGVSGEGLSFEITPLMADSVYMVVGKLKPAIAKAEDRDPNSMVLQSIRFKKEVEKNGEFVPTGWTVAKAKAWWEKSGEKKSKYPKIKEVRMADIRAKAKEPEDDDEKMIVEGYAIRFDEPAYFDIGEVRYTEVIDKKALDNTDMKDVVFKYNHSQDIMIMARTRSKTLQLEKDKQGLKISAELAKTSTGRDLYELIKRGDIDKMSFAFTISEDKYNKDTKTRTILAIDKIFDVSAVETPAYETTSISARSFFEAEAEKEYKALEKAELRKKLLLLTYL